MMKGVALVLLAALVMAQLLVHPSEAIICNQVNGAITPCVTYLTNGGKPSDQCCKGVKNVNSMMATRADRQAACSCLQKAAANYKTIKNNLAASLPQACGVSVSIPIGGNVDCSRIA